MAFQSFRYAQAAEQGLAEIFRERLGDELKRKIASWMREWDPDPDDEEPFSIVSFRGRLLVFTVSARDRSILILAGVEREPYL